MNSSSLKIDRSVNSDYRKFIELCDCGGSGFRLTTNSEISPYALCFAIFGLHLLRDSDAIACYRDRWNDLLRRNLHSPRFTCQTVEKLQYDKSYLQLLTFSLSALSILGTLEEDPLEEIVLSVIPSDIALALDYCGALRGLPRSGNQAMFLGILLIHARDWLGRNTQSAIDEWVDLHLDAVNQFGFWGDAKSMSHLQFQNSYHQYEVFDYLNVANPLASSAAESVALLADVNGHFAPYPGGGGCYDYDAVFVLTSAGQGVVDRCRDLLLRTARSILSEQNPDGGFCESQYIRPRSTANALKMVRHIYAARGKARLERLRYCLTLQRPVHDRINTHWSQYSRRWNESDLWDSWFRMLTIARIDVALHGDAAAQWGFINYPGIGFHHSVARGGGL